MIHYSVESDTFQVFTKDKNNANRQWRVRLVYNGDKYGLNNCLVHEENNPMIEFYDLDNQEIFGGEGQFVSRYYLDTILLDGICFNKDDILNAHERPKNQGLNLDGGVPAWTISGDCLDEILEEVKLLYIKKQLADNYQN